MSNLRYGIDVNSFVAITDIGAEHFYADAWVYDDEKNELIEKTHMDRVIDSNEAIYLNQKDHTFKYGLKAGDSTIRFRDTKSAIDAGVKFLLNKYGKRINIELGPYNAINENLIIY